MQTPIFSIVRWPHGWTINSIPGTRGIPLDAISQCIPLLKRGSVLHPGIAHHLKYTGHPETVVAAASPKDAETWEAEIKTALENLPPQARWWKGTDVGASSAALFACFQSEGHPSKEYGGENTPRDADDIERCFRLLDLFPEWESQLDKVAQAYPQSRWPALVDRWSELKSLRTKRAELNQTLREIAK